MLVRIVLIVKPKMLNALISVKVIWATRANPMPSIAKLYDSFKFDGFLNFLLFRPNWFGYVFSIH